MTHGWGFVGTGGIAATVADALERSEGGHLAAVASRDEGRAAAFASARGASGAYGGDDAVERLLADPGVDVVYVATTHPQHHAPALAALRAGTPVLVEKPMTVTLAATRDLVETARSTSTFLMEAYWTRLLPGTAALLDVIASGEVGRVRSVHADLGFTVGADVDRFHDPAIGGGSLLDLGPYPVGLAVTLLGSPQEVRALGTLTGTGVDEQVALAVRFPGGELASLSTTMVASARSAAWVEGSEGSVELDPFLPTATGFTVRSAREGARAEVRHDHAVEHGHRFMLDHVHECLDQGLTESPLVTHRWSLDVAGILEDALVQVGVERRPERL